jgi:hypothetical protein
MAVERRAVVAALSRKGFLMKSGDHTFLTYETIEGKRTSVWTKVSHGSGHKMLADPLVSLMAKQCGLNKGQFNQLIDCPLSRSAYEQLLLDNGRIKTSP